MEAAGLAIGLVPLGMKLIREVTGYFEGLERRDFEVEATRIQLSILDTTLGSIDSELLAIGPLDVRTRDNVEKSCDLMRQQMNHISDFVKSLKLGAIQSGSKRDRTKAKAMELVYPFRRESLKDLQTQLRDLNTTLNMALRPLDRHFHRELHAETEGGHSRQLETVMLQLLRLQEATPAANNIVQLAASMSRQPAALEDIASKAAVTTAQVHRNTASLDAQALSNAFLGISSFRKPRYRCSCPVNEQKKRNLRQIGGLVVMYDEESRGWHRPDCKFSGEERKTSHQTFSVGWRHRTSQSYISKVVALAVNFSMASGKSTFVPLEIQAYNYVELPASPLVTLLNLRWYRSLSKDFEEGVSRHLRKLITRLLEERRASFRDIDFRDGSTLLHYLAVFRNLSPMTLSCLEELNISKDTVDFGGRTAWQGMHDHAAVPFDEIEIYDSLFPEEPNFVRGRAYVNMVARMAQICQNNPSVLYGTSFGPICRAIILQSPSIVQELHGNIDALREVLIPGVRSRQAISALDLAAIWHPALLKHLILEFDDGVGPVRTLEAVSKAGSSSVLSHLLEGMDLAREQQRDPDPYIEAIEMVVSLDCPIEWDIAFARTLAKSAFRRIRPLVLHHFADRRRRLNQLAIAELPSTKTRELELESGSVLDQSTQDVFKELQLHSCYVPASLDPGAPKERFFLKHDISVFSYMCCDGGLAEGLYQSGFRPDSMLLRYAKSCSEFSIRTKLAYSPHHLHWLWQRCKPETLEQNVRKNVSLKHWMMVISARSIGEYCTFQGWHKDGPLLPSESIMSCMSLFLDADEGHTDTCSCRCSLSGCTPLIRVAHAAHKNTGDRQSTDIEADELPSWVSILASAVDMAAVKPRLADGHAASLLRMLTFVALGCCHTCCRSGLEASELPDEAERDAVQQEDKQQLLELELITERAEILWAACDLSLYEFVHQHWWPAVIAARQSMQPVKEDNQASLVKIRELGVQMTEDGLGEEQNSDDGSWYLDSDVVSECSSVDSDADETEVKRVDEAKLMAFKRAMNRASGLEDIESGVTTGRGRRFRNRRADGYLYP